MLHVFVYRWMHTHRLSSTKSKPHQFFDESIVAKLNRSKTQLKKGDTAFLDDATDAVTETFNPPPPSNWYVACGVRVVCLPIQLMKWRSSIPPSLLAIHNP